MAIAVEGKLGWCGKVKVGKQEQWCAVVDGDGNGATKALQAAGEGGEVLQLPFRTEFLV